MQKFEQINDHYIIKVGFRELNDLRGKIMNNESLAPEIVGNLIGRAAAVTVDMVCEKCKKPIEVGSFSESNMIWGLQFPTRLHQICYDELQAARKKAMGIDK